MLWYVGVELHVFAMARDFHFEGSEANGSSLFSSTASLAELRPDMVVLHFGTAHHE
jgi:hypothetical protein